MSIVTKTGDKGTTGLFGPDRLPKDHPRIEANGTIDELNSVLGLIAAEVEAGDSTLAERISSLQHLLFRIGADLATPMHVRAKQARVTAEHVRTLEASITAIEADLPPQRAFILPGGTRSSALFHFARTICRRAERRVLTLARSETVNEQLLILLNRLSDYLFVLARKANADEGVGDVEVQYS